MAIHPTPPPPKKRQNRNEETKIQVACVIAFREKYPQYRKQFFAIINENEQSKYETKEQQAISGSRRKARGVIAGVADTQLAVPSRGYHGAFLECKKPDGSQSDDQIEWQKEMENMGYYYAVFKSKEQFMAIVDWYLSEDFMQPLVLPPLK